MRLEPLPCPCPRYEIYYNARIDGFRFVAKVHKWEAPGKWRNGWLDFVEYVGGP
jgi:hypothetical protein